MPDEKIIIHTDGGSRGNPGPAASGFVVEVGDEIVCEGSKYLGKQTNNVAEYSAVVLALEWIISSLPKRYTLLPITFYLDSELVVKQIKGIYKVKDLNLQKLHSKIQELIKQITVDITFLNVPREQNKKADLLANQELDKHH